MNDERWLPLPEDTSYEVSSLGRVRSSATGRLYKLTASSINSYPRIRLNGRSRKVHQLVMLAFIGSYPADKPHINHKDADKTNNRLENLEFVSHAENAMHAYKLGLIGQRLRETDAWCRGEMHGNAKLTAAKVREARRRAAAGEGVTATAREFGVSVSALWKAVTRETWAHVK